MPKQFLKVGVGVKKSTLRTISTLAILVLVLFFSSFSVTLAGDPSTGGLVPCGISSPCTLCHFIIGFHKLVLYGIYLVMALALLALFFTGITYILSSGDQGLMAAAKGFLKGSFIGFAVVSAGWLIITATLWAVSARGDLGIGRTGSWSSFSCNTASSALNPVAPQPPSTAPPAAPGSAAAAGTAGAACGNNNVGRCVAASTQSSSTAFSVCTDLGKTWILGGTSCNSGLYCCGDKISAGSACTASVSGGSGTCQQLYGTGGVGTTMADAIVCPNRSWRLQQATNADLLCDTGLGCCDMSPANANTAPGIQDAACGPVGSDGTCVPGTITASCPTGKVRAGTSSRSCGSGLICCATASTVPTSFTWDGVSP